MTCRTSLKDQLPGYLVLMVLILALTADFLSSGTLSMKDVGAGLLSLVGTYVGAFLAFRVQAVKDRKTAVDAEVVAVNRALLVMCVQYNHLATTKISQDRYTSRWRGCSIFRPRRTANDSMPGNGLKSWPSWSIEARRT